MSGSLQLSRVALSVTVTLPAEMIELNVGYLPWVLGDSLAAQVATQVSEQRLGYFPALDYFRGNAAVDGELIELIDAVAQFGNEFTCRELRRRLTRVFSSVQVTQSTCQAYTMPRVRPGGPQALAELGRHYAPDRIRLDLVVSTAEKVPNPEPVRQAVTRVHHWAREPFACLEVSAARVVK